MSNKPSRRVARQQARSRATGAGNSGTSAINSRAIWIGVAAVILVAIGVGVLVATNGGNDSDREAAVEVGFAETVGGDPLPAYGDDPVDPAVGTPAPSFRSQSMWSGDVVEVDGNDGAVQLVGFFAHWCPHCQREVPAVTAWFAENGVPSGVEVYAVSTSVNEGRPNYPPSEWFDREGWPFDVLVDTVDGQLARDFGLSSFPYWVVIGPDGVVTERVSGEMTDAQFTAFVERASALL